MPDGRRQIGEFLLPGDLFGWEALGEHSFGAEAVTQVALRRHSRRSLETSAERDPAFARRLRALTARKLRAGQEHALILGRMTASERIARFLLDMAARMNGATDAFVDLPMSRADIADYLGLTAETVCRELTQMQRQSIIAIDRAQIVIRDSRVLHIRGGARPGAPRLQVIAAEFLAAVPDGTPGVRGV